jgi:ankyrin repeat protein
VGNCPFTKILGANAVILSILYEKPDILMYFLENYEVDFCFTVNGWNALHFAACTKDYRCLELLLQCGYVQEHIDEGIIPCFYDDDQEGFTTALHVAVTNKRHAQAILLTQELPEVSKLQSKVTSPYTLNMGGIVSNQPANPCALSLSGNTPLHIAAYQKDWDMCQILLNAGAETQQLNKKGQTPIDIAKERKCDNLAEKLESGNYGKIESLRKKYLIEEKKEKEDKSAEHDEVDKLKSTIKNLTELVEQLSEKVSVYERNAEEAKTKVCPQCGFPMTNGKCPICK